MQIPAANSWNIENDSWSVVHATAATMTMRGFCAGCKQLATITYPYWQDNYGLGYHCPNCGPVLDWDKLAPLANEGVQVLCEWLG